MPSSVFPSRPDSAFALWSPEMASPGGVQSYMWRLWEMLTAIAISDGTPPKGLSLVDTSESLAAWPNSTPARPCGADGNKFRFGRLALGPKARARCVVVGHLNQAPVAWLAWRLGRIDRYVVVLHGIEAWQRQSLVRRIALRHAHAVVATTHCTALRCAAANGLSESNFKVVPLCAEPAPASCDSGFRLDGEFPILFVGRLAKSEQYKGLETLMQAVKRLIDGNIPAKLHVIGDGDDRSRLLAISHSTDLPGDTICFHGRVSAKALQAAYASAKVFAMPSANEGFGIVFLEAMRHGVACIGGAHGGTPEVFQDGLEGFLVPYGDVGILAQRLRELAMDPVLRVRLGNAGQRRFETDYTFAAFSTRWADLLSSSFQASAPPAS